MNYDIFRRIDKIMKAQRRKNNELNSYLKVNNSTYDNWRRGKSESYLKYINEIADFLQVDPKELTGDTDIDLAVKKQDPKEDKLLSLFRSVTDSEKELLIKVVDTFVLRLRKARQQTT